MDKKHHPPRGSRVAPRALPQPVASTMGVQTVQKRALAVHERGTASSMAKYGQKRIAVREENAAAAAAKR